MEDVSSEEQSILASPTLFFRFLVLGTFLIGLGLFINRVPSLSPPTLQVLESDAKNQSVVLSDKKEAASPGSNSDKTDEYININSASQIDLESLPGIGPKTAIKIIANRPYSALADLVSKNVISFKLFDQIKKQISL